jgi:hypothetical protein
VEGKEVSRMNAVKHGLLAQHVVLPWEDADEFARFAASIHEEIRPVGETETVLTDLVVGSAWRLRRVMRIEKGLLIRESYVADADRARREAQHYVSWPDSVEEQLANIDTLRGQEVITDPRAYEDALQRRREAMAVADSVEGKLGLAYATNVVHSGDAVSKLSRYEDQLLRRMLKMLAEVGRLQACRAQGPNARTSPDRLENP